MGCSAAGKRYSASDADAGITDSHYYTGSTIADDYTGSTIADGYADSGYAYSDSDYADTDAERNLLPFRTETGANRLLLCASDDGSHQRQVFLRH